VFVSTLNGPENGPELVILDAKTRREVKRLKMGRGAAGIQMQPDGARAYVGLHARPATTHVMRFNFRTELDFIYSLLIRKS
jgi:hypothetical protein